jgi:hypothetical protein
MDTCTAPAATITEVATADPKSGAPASAVPSESRSYRNLNSDKP